MNRRKKDGGGGTAWMTTFTDISLLLLTFFVLLLSFATMDIVKFRDAMGSIQEALGFMPAGRGMFQHTSTPSQFEKPMATSTVKSANEAIMQELEELVREKGLQEDVELENSARGVIMRVRGRMFFHAGTADLKPKSETILKKISHLMKKFPSRIAIEGHTDNIPISSGRYSSNWELSTARAFSALKYLQESEDIPVERIHIAGFAETHPLVSNDTPEGRVKNRRVEFVFYEE